MRGDHVPESISLRTADPSHAVSAHHRPSSRISAPIESGMTNIDPAQSYQTPLAAVRNSLADAGTFSVCEGKAQRGSRNGTRLRSQAVGRRLESLVTCPWKSVNVRLRGVTLKTTMNR